MTKTFSSREASQKLEELLDDLAERDDVAIVERDGDPVAVVISFESYRQLIDSQADRDWSTLDRLRNRNRTVDVGQAEQDIEEAITEVRRARRRSAWGRFGHKCVRELNDPASWRQHRCPPGLAPAGVHVDHLSGADS
jgi:prevent-host-death family protein